MVILDSLMVNDSLVCPDSLAALDSISQADSIFAFDSILKGKSDIQKLKVKMVDEMPKVLRNTVHSDRKK